MAEIRKYQIFDNVDYLENYSDKIENNSRFAFITKDIKIIQHIEDILNSVEDSVFTNNYVLDFYKTSADNNKINYYSRSGRVHYAKNIIVEIETENSVVGNFEKNIMNSLFSNIEYKENNKPTVTLKNQTVIYLTELEFTYVTDYLTNENKVLKYYSSLPLFSRMYNMHDFLKLKNCVFLDVITPKK